MDTRRSPILRQIITVFAVTILFIPFQNCGGPGTIDRPELSEKLANGPGTDGKIEGSYVSYGICDNVVGVKSAVVFSEDKNSARQLVKDCQPLNVPPVIDVSELQFLEDSSFVFDSEIYDRHVLSGTQKVTLQVCQAAGRPTVQARVWKTLGAQSSYFGRIKLGSGADSGDLIVQTPLANSTRYISQAGQSSQFDLSVNASTASLIYSLNGGSATLQNGLACLDQMSPMTDDGFASASVGSPQHMTLLNDYHVRPSWKVAGVDYPVGIPSTTVLKNPASIQMTGVSVDLTNHLIRIVGDNVTLDGYDFSMGGGFGVYVIGAKNAAIRNSKFSGSAIQTDAQSSNLSVRYCNIDGGGATSSSGFIYMLGGGHVVMEHNWIRNFPDRLLVNNNGESAMMRYNLIEDSFGNSGFNYLYFSGGRSYAPIRVLFNTVYQTRQSGSDRAVGFVLDGMPGSAVTIEFAYNTMITIPSNGRSAIGTLVQGSTPNTVTAAWLHHNYVDSRGAANVFADDLTAGITNFYSHNFEMNSGAVISVGLKPSF